MKERECIFNFSNPEWKYKGVFSGVIDNAAVEKGVGAPFALLKICIVKIIAFVWVDEKGIWNFRVRIKFPSGNKQTFAGSLGEDSNAEEAVKIICKMPMREKHWFPNPDETLMGLIEVMRVNDLI